MPLFRTVALLLLAGWSVLLSLESWFRPPGPANPFLFPAELRLGGVGYRRVPPRANLSPLPEGVTVREASDYRSSTGQRFSLKWLTLASSGTGVHLPLDSFTQAVLGDGGRGACFLPAGPGQPQPYTVVRTSSDFQHGLPERLPRGLDRLRWLAGLRPLLPHGCLWMGRSGPPAGRAEPIRLEPPVLPLRP